MSSDYLGVTCDCLVVMGYYFVVARHYLVVIRKSWVVTCVYFGSGDVLLGGAQSVFHFDVLDCACDAFALLCLLCWVLLALFCFALFPKQRLR